MPREEVAGSIGFPEELERRIVSDFRARASFDIEAYPVNGRSLFKLRVRSGVDPGHSIIEWHSDDLAQACLEICDAFQSCVLASKPDPTRLKRLAEIGSDHFRAIFRSGSLSTVLGAAAKAGTHVSFSVESPDFIYPWGLLYTGNPNRKIDPLLFLGMSSTFHRFLWSRDLNKANQPARKRTTNPVDALVGWCDTLKECEKNDLATLRNLVASGNIGRLAEIPLMSGNTAPKSNARKMAAFISKEQPRYVHLACHATAGPTPRRRQIRLRSSAYMSESDIANSQLKLRGDATIFLNACEGGVVNPAHYSSMSRLLLERGAKTIIAPECTLSDARAGKFATLFLQEVFKEGQSVTDALRKATAKNWHNNRDLTGLAYAVYERPDRIFP